jgi:DNA-binding NtrC family response regulator
MQSNTPTHNTPPWTTCFLTRMMVCYLDEQGAESPDYGGIMADTHLEHGAEDPKNYLMNPNNWVPHVVLQRLVAMAERATGSKEAAYHAARRHFASKQNPSLVEIIATHLDDVRQVLHFSNLWSAGFTNYLQMQCIPLEDPDRCEATILAKFSDRVIPRLANLALVRGCYEGIAGLFDDIDAPSCVEEISQVALEGLVQEFDRYHLERREGQEWKDSIFIIETASKQEIAALKKVGLQTETTPLAPFFQTSLSEGNVCPPIGGRVTCLSPKVTGQYPDPGHAVYRVIGLSGESGLLQTREGVGFRLQVGQCFNAPYSRYRFTWKSKKTRNDIQRLRRRAEIVPLLLRHVSELRETHQRLLQCFIENQSLKQTNTALRSSLYGQADIFGMTGKTPVMQALFDKVRLAAPTDTTLLIVGETGAGKELVAKAIHRLSLRRDRPLYTINCAALTESLLEAELFGYEKGAFTGALAQKRGIFETATGGTVALDEVSECSHAMQAKLLRVLENMEIQRIGGRETIRVDVRILALSNKDLTGCVASGHFRKDLLYRLNVIVLNLPPLRDRHGDMQMLIDYFFAFFSQKHKKQKPSLSAEALALLTGYHWPGNVRQLKNEIERAVVLSQQGRIMPDDFVLSGDEATAIVPAHLSYHESIEAYRRQLLETALQKAGGNRTLAAKRLGLQRTYLSRLIGKIDLSTPV